MRRAKSPLLGLLALLLVLFMCVQSFAQVFVDNRPHVRKPPFGSVEIDPRFRAFVVGEYLFNEGGGVPHNLVRPLADTLGAGTTWTIGNSGLALRFDGSSTTSVQTQIVAPSPVFTWLVRFTIRTSAPVHYRSLITTAGASYMLMDIAQGADNLIVFSSDGLSGTSFGITGLSVGRLYEIAFVREGDSITNGYKAYLDGQFKGQANTGTWSPTAGQFLWFGQRADTNDPHDGTISQISIFPVALSAAAILTRYAEPYAFLRYRPAISFGFMRTRTQAAAASSGCPPFPANTLSWCPGPPATPGQPAIEMRP